jgi:hypothetical protein
MIRLASLTYERRQELIDAIWGAVMVAFTILLTALALWLAVAMVVGSVAMGRWLGGAV